eukprot:CAMPEP_0202446156 /NCGR_PEP_ID=MMETSP1360-20130828/4761_1 /ASSEMBLY_ACC=CAM_ASM_000848 /TAXON_ID=515479 /ORGANISM="Licmophora paradoxa, Strain CCMP2313" /LENGTH=82 /DNA_ID=CAMNT_0049062597 /DNA_START=101 /DNA_END=349 /DNA_ORIENTATION=-
MATSFPSSGAFGYPTGSTNEGSYMFPPKSMNASAFRFSGKEEKVAIAITTTGAECYEKTEDLDEHVSSSNRVPFVGNIEKTE